MGVEVNLDSYVAVVVILIVVVNPNSAGPSTWNVYSAFVGGTTNESQSALVRVTLLNPC